MGEVPLSNNDFSACTVLVGLLGGCLLVSRTASDDWSGYGEKDNKNDDAVHAYPLSPVELYRNQQARRVAYCFGSSVNPPLAPEVAPAPPESLLVELDDFYFDPKEIDGKVGETLAVTAFSEGQETHTLTIDALGVDRGVPASDTQESRCRCKRRGSSRCTAGTTGTRG